MQVGQKLEIEFASKFRILVGSPFIQQQDRTPFEQADNKSEAHALSARKINGVELAVGKARFVVQPELGEQIGELGHVRIGHAIEPLKQVEIGKYRGDQAPII